MEKLTTKPLSLMEEIDYHDYKLANSGDTPKILVKKTKSLMEEIESYGKKISNNPNS